MTDAVVYFARCPEHGLHGERTHCFVCGGPVEQVPMVSLRAYEIVVEEREALRRERDVLVEAARLARPERKTRALGQDPLPAYVRDPVRARSRGLCVCCGRPGRDPHHLLPVNRFPEFRLEPDLIVWVCRRCHDGHECGLHRLPFECLPQCALDKLSDQRVTDYVLKTYPKTRVEAER